MPSVISSLKDQKVPEDPWCSATVICKHCDKQVGGGLKIDFAVEWHMSYDDVLSELGERLRSHMKTSEQCSHSPTSSKDILASVQAHVAHFWSEDEPKATVDPDSADAFLRRMLLKNACTPSGSRTQDRAAAPPAKHAKKQPITITVAPPQTKKHAYSKAVTLPPRQQSEDRMFMKL